MKFKIEDKNNEEKEVKLSLKQYGKDVVVKGTDNNRETWNLVLFKEDGAIRRFHSVPDDIGIKVDEDGRIVIFN